MKPWVRRWEAPGDTYQADRGAAQILFCLRETMSGVAAQLQCGEIGTLLQAGLR